MLPLNIRVCELQLGPIKSQAFIKQKESLSEYKKNYKDSEFTPRLSNLFAKIIYTPERKEKSPIIIAKLIEKLISQKKYKVRYEPGKKRLASFLLTKLPPKWIDKYFLKKI